MACKTCTSGKALHARAGLPRSATRHPGVWIPHEHLLKLQIPFGGVASEDVDDTARAHGRSHGHPESWVTAGLQKASIHMRPHARRAQTAPKKGNAGRLKASALACCLHKNSGLIHFSCLFFGGGQSRLEPLSAGMIESVKDASINEREPTSFVA